MTLQKFLDCTIMWLSQISQNPLSWCSSVWGGMVVVVSTPFFILISLTRIWPLIFAMSLTMWGIRSLNMPSDECFSSSGWKQYSHTGLMRQSESGIRWRNCWWLVWTVQNTTPWAPCGVWNWTSESGAWIVRGSPPTTSIICALSFSRTKITLRHEIKKIKTLFASYDFIANNNIHMKLHSDAILAQIIYLSPWCQGWASFFVEVIKPRISQYLLEPGVFVALTLFRPRSPAIMGILYQHAPKSVRPNG